MRTRRVILLASAGAIGGSFSAHLAGAITRPVEVEGLVPEVHRSAAVAPAIVAVVLVLTAALLLRSRLKARSFAVVLAATPVVAFALQEWLERVLSAEASPFEHAREPGVLAAVAALLPWIVGAFVIARLAIAISRATASGGSRALVLVPAAVGAERAPILVPAHTGRFDSVLDRPPRAPPLP